MNNQTACVILLRKMAAKLWGKIKLERTFRCLRDCRSSWEYKPCTLELLSATLMWNKIKLQVNSRYNSGLEEEMGGDLKQLGRLYHFIFL